MKINIKNNFRNCSTVTFNGTTIINGRRIDGKSKSQEFDEKKVEESNGIDKIVIDSSFVDINISSSNSSKIETHFHGSAILDRDINFDVKVINRELRIKIEYSGNCCNSTLKLDIDVPVEKTFKLISVNTMSGDINLNEKVSTEDFKVRTQSGDLETIYANLKNVSIKTMSGDVELIIKAKKDIDLDINTMSGDVNVQLNNISRVANISTHSMSGDITNRYIVNAEGYSANIDISTMSGDIKIS